MAGNRFIAPKLTRQRQDDIRDDLPVTAVRRERDAAASQDRRPRGMLAAYEEVGWTRPLYAARRTENGVFIAYGYVFQK